MSESARIPLGRLMRMDDLRRPWPDEARSFTPWLAQPENLTVLSEALGLGDEGLQLERTEVFVGAYKADILARETGSGDWVLIENQLERTDHSHLGQLIVYAAGLGARTIVWVSRQVSPEHKAAMDWLNTISPEGPSFFALEIELWKIGDSLPAPRFNVVVSPNDWSRSATNARNAIADGELTTAQQELLDYWSAFEAALDKRRGAVRAVKPLPQNWMVHSIGRTGLNLNTTINRRDKWVRAEVYLTGPQARRHFNALVADKAGIEAATGPLIWYDGSEKDRRIWIERKFPSVSDRASWPEQHAWLADRLNLLHGAFHDRVRRLDPGRSHDTGEADTP